MKHRKYILWIGLIVTILLICVASNIVAIGDKLTGISATAGQVYYIVVLAVTTGAIGWPILSIVCTPEVKCTNAIAPEIRSRLKDQVKESAKTSLLLTTVSQNGSVDILANAAINFSLIWKLVRLAGFRPTLVQIVKLYTSVLSTSFIVASADELIDTLDIGGIVGNAGVGAVCKVFQPLVNGAANAYTCLRVGYATIRYLEVGNKQYKLNRKNIRREISKEARKDLAVVFKDEAVGLVKRFK